MAKVTLKNVSKIYPGEKGGGVTAASDLSLEIQDKEFVVLLGPAGTGKSTILRMIAGLEEISRGEIVIGDRGVNDVPPKDRDIAMVFQDGALYPHMSIGENLAFGLQAREFAKTEIKNRVHDAAVALGIEDLLDRKPSSLSVVQRQRVAVGRAIARQPKVILFDEPLKDLDPTTQGQMRTEIRKLHQRLQVTMIYATDDSAEAMTMGDRIVVIDHGVVQQSDPPHVIYSEPANLFAARALGVPPMNLIHGTLKQERDALLFRESGEGTIEARISPTDHPGASDFVGKPVVLGFRPEDMEIAQVTKGQEVARGAFPALVDSREDTGPATVLHLETGAHRLVCRTREPLAAGGEGRRMRFEINLKKAHLFDPVSTLRLA